MLNSIKKLLGLGPKANFSELMAEVAIIIDVRTKGEFAGGHIKGSLNIPLDTFGQNLGKIKDKTKAHYLRYDTIVQQQLKLFYNFTT